MIHFAWVQPFTTKSDFAKTEADWIATAASLGFITTISGHFEMGRKWLPTPEGLALIFNGWPRPDA